MKIEWKPIETAPKDGRAILACVKGYDENQYRGGWPLTVRFEIYHPNAPGKGTWRNHLGHKENFLTHWTEMPEGPK